MEILLLFVDRRGQLVTREEIIERVWGKDVFLDTDNGINAAISKLRQVLRDDPENPVSIQTIKGKGYRFIAAVTDIGVTDLPPTDVSQPKVVSARERENPGISVKAAPAALPLAATTPIPNTKRRWIFLLAVAAVLGSLAVAFFMRF